MSPQGEARHQGEQAKAALEVSKARHNTQGGLLSNDTPTNNPKGGMAEKKTKVKHDKSRKHRMNFSGS